MSKPEYRKAQHSCFCRVCDKQMKVGDMVVFFYSGQNISICPRCVEIIYDIVKNGEQNES